jgi:DNA-binding NtrC family response regulator
MRESRFAGGSSGFVGESPQICHVRRRIEQIGDKSASVLILGETGTGKEVAARAIYATLPRGQFVPIDCGTLSGQLMESELFGHVRGAFTGAVTDKKGLLAEADGGTAFFDEIGDLAPELQVKLLRFLQERQYRPVGSSKWLSADVRVIAATNRDLPHLISQGKFRDDLFHRLNVVKLSLPPLRERKEDIPLLIDHFLRKQPRPVALAPELIELLTAFDWPGNVRQLEHCIQRMVAMSTDGVLTLEHLPSYVAGHAHAQQDGFVPAMEPEEIVPLKEVERRAILRAYSALGDKDEAARRLGIGRTTLYRKLKEYGID